MSWSRAIVVVGMHRSGTSAVARGLKALSVYLGRNFLDAQPENPTGYWEDKGIVELNERVLKALRLTWDGVAPIARRSFGGWRMWRLRREARRYLRRSFIEEPLWGFKDPRTLRLLSFWLRVFHESDVNDAYVLVIRNPSSVAASLFKRQGMQLETAQRLWLVYTLPYLEELASKPMVVVDYDLLMGDPRGQLERIARKLQLTATTGDVENFTCEFLDAKLRHTVFSPEEIDATSEVGRLTRDAYTLLYEVAADRRDVDRDFWSAWGSMTQERLVERG
ncbi:MAG: sulfotransferase [Candidatus Cybelea sp.]